MPKIKYVVTERPSGGAQVVYCCERCNGYGGWPDPCRKCGGTGLSGFALAPPPTSPDRASDAEIRDTAPEVSEASNG